MMGLNETIRDSVALVTATQQQDVDARDEIMHATWRASHTPTSDHSLLLRSWGDD